MFGEFAGFYGRRTLCALQRSGAILGSSRRRAGGVGLRKGLWQFEMPQPCLVMPVEADRAGYEVKMLLPPPVLL